jgi:hypothetical protein
MIYEVRNYHFRPDLFEAYKVWAKERALPFLSGKLDLVGFWANTANAPEVIGAPVDELGSANITWVIRWRDLEQRNKELPAALGSAEWEEIFSHVPGGMSSYLRIEAKFAEALA